MGFEFFTVGLRDKVTGPAKKMADAAGKLEEKLGKLDSRGRRRSANGRFLGDGSKKNASGGGLLGGILGGKKRSSGGHFSSLSGEIKLLGLAAIATGAALTYKLGAAITDTANLAGQSKLAFSAMLGGDAAADKQIDIAIEKSKKYGIALADVIEGQQQFMALGFSAGQANTMTDLVADMRFLGASEEKLKRVSLALSQIQSAGKLEGDEIRQLGEAGLPVGKLYQRIGENLGLVAKGGKSVVQQVKKLKEAGKIESDVALNSIGEVLLMTVKKNKLGEAGEEAANKTVGGTINRIEALLGAGMFRAVQKAEPALVKGLNAVFAGIDSADGGLFAEKMTGFLEGVGSLLSEIGPKMPDIAKNFISAFSSAAGFDNTSFKSFADSLPGAATSLGTIAGYMATIAGFALKIGSAFDLFWNGNTSVKATDMLGIDSTSILGKVLNTSPDSIMASVGDFVSGKEHKLGPDVPQEQMGSPDLWKVFEDSGVAPMSESAFFASRELESSGNLEGQVAAPLRNFDAITAQAADSVGERSSKTITVGDINVPITISGSGSPRETAEEVQGKFEDEIGAHFDRLIQGGGG